MKSFRQLAIGIVASVCLAGMAQGAPGKAIEDPAFNPHTGIRPAQKVPFPVISDWRTLRIRLERSGCYGTCPIYSVEISGDGTVNYLGERFVKVSGGQTARINRKAVHDLYNAFAKADFFWTLDSYESPVTDMPTYIVSISFDGHAKSVLDYAGKSQGLPKAVADLEDAIDKAAGTEKWVRDHDL
jgi:hypothetical protein